MGRRRGRASSTEGWRTSAQSQIAVVIWRRRARAHRHGSRSRRGRRWRAVGAHGNVELAWRPGRSLLSWRPRRTWWPRRTWRPRLRCHCACGIVRHMMHHMVLLNVAVDLLAALGRLGQVPLHLPREVQGIQRRERHARGQVDLVPVFQALGQELLELLSWPQARDGDLCHFLLLVRLCVAQCTRARRTSGGRQLLGAPTASSSCSCLWRIISGFTRPLS